MPKILPGRNTSHPSPYEDVRRLQRSVAQLASLVKDAQCNVDQMRTGPTVGSKLVMAAYQYDFRKLALLGALARKAKIPVPDIAKTILKSGGLRAD